jgi:hypothetical protein
LGDDTVKDRSAVPEKKRVSEAGIATIAIVVATSGALLALALPRPVAPDETPGLTLDATRVRDQLERDGRSAAALPDAPEVDAVREVLAAQSRAEVDGLPETSVRERQIRAVRAVTALVDAHGPDALTQLRAEAAERIDTALSSEPPADDEERKAVVGGFETMLERYGLSKDGELVAPRLVVRTLYKARVNAALYLELTDGFTELENEAYWGWLALEADAIPPERRLAALDELERATGARHDEARGTLLFLAGESLAAADLLDRAYAETGCVRLRNHALAAVESAVE